MLEDRLQHTYTLAELLGYEEARVLGTCQTHSFSGYYEKLVSYT
jgi:hypothetical protein